MPSQITTESEQVPVIDFSLLNCDLESTYAQVKKACEEWGCFLVVNHGIEERIIDEMDSVARDTFALPKETKRKKDSVGWNLGYMGDMPALPFFESIGVPGAPDPEAIQKFSDHLWPQGNTKIREIVEAYIHSVNELTINIIKAILSSFGVGRHYSSSEFVGVLRMNYCNSPPHQKGGTLVHTDTSCIAVIYQDNNGGLKVKSKAGKWVDVKPVSNSFVVLSGDLFKAWSNGRIHNVTHRLLCDGISRVSVPYIYFFTDQTVIDAPAEFLDEEHPRLYSPFVFADYRDHCQQKRMPQLMDEHSFVAVSHESFLDKFAGISALNTIWNGKFMFPTID